MIYSLSKGSVFFFRTFGPVVTYYFQDRTKFYCPFWPEFRTTNIGNFLNFWSGGPDFLPALAHFYGRYPTGNEPWERLDLLYTFKNLQCITIQIKWIFKYWFLTYHNIENDSLSAMYEAFITKVRWKLDHLYTRT